MPCMLINTWKAQLLSEIILSIIFVKLQLNLVKMSLKIENDGKRILLICWKDNFFFIKWDLNTNTFLKETHSEMLQCYNFKLKGIQIDYEPWWAEDGEKNS